jgi:hypothetical protein
MPVTGESGNGFFIERRTNDAFHKRNRKEAPGAISSR